MANNCFYTIHAHSKDENALKRLLSIMKYEDPEYYIYRCFDAMLEEQWVDGEYYGYEISGDVAWSCSSWFEDTEDFSRTTDNGAHYITLDKLCAKLGIALELYCEESGCEFQQHFTCTNEGTVSEETVEWTECWQDENGNNLDEPIETGGFGDEYLNFCPAYDLFV